MGIGGEMAYVGGAVPSMVEAGGCVKGLWEGGDEKKKKKHTYVSWCVTVEKFVTCCTWRRSTSWRADAPKRSGSRTLSITAGGRGSIIVNDFSLAK